MAEYLEVPINDMAGLAEAGLEQVHQAQQSDGALMLIHHHEAGDLGGLHDAEALDGGEGSIDS